MNILVTGGCGLVGQGVVSQLAAGGHGVRVVDLKLSDEREPGVDYLALDITSFPALRGAARGMDAIVHLAAYTYPGAAPGPDIFRVNCTGTYNVFESAAQEGIKRVALASSINALGYNFGVKGFPIRYFPIDEDHPTCTTDPYSFSKQTTEAIAAYYWRRDGISSACLRMPMIYATASADFASWGRQSIEASRRVMADLKAMPGPERERWLARMFKGLEASRVERWSEQPWEGGDEPFDFTAPEFFPWLGYTDFWTILSVEDCAAAFEQCLTAPFEGSHPLYLTEDENAAGEDSETLARLFYPEVIERKAPLTGVKPLVSTQKARDLIGFNPHRRVREEFR